MRYAQIRSMDISNGEGCGVALFTQGCDIHCPGCFNTIAWDYAGGKEWTSETEQRILTLLKPEYISRFSILGGEAFSKQNTTDLLMLVTDIKIIYPDKQIWIYSGHTYEELSQNPNYMAILRYVDVLVDGRYEQDKRDITLAFRGSSNQRIIDVQQTLKKGEIVLYGLNN